LSLVRHQHAPFSVVAFALALVSCGGGTSVPPDPPNTLVYSTNPAVYTLNLEITPNTPTNKGGASESYSVTPDLPPGLSLNTSTGVIGGTPLVVSASTTYVVTARNVSGSTNALLPMSVITGIPGPTPLPPGLGPVALVTDVAWPTSCDAATGTGALSIGPASSVVAAPSYTQRGARGCVNYPLAQVWQALQIPTGVDIGFWPERNDSDCEAWLIIDPIYPVNCVTREIPHGGIESHYTFEVSWRAGIQTGTPTVPTEVRMLYGKTSGTVEVPKILGSMVFTADPLHPGWTRIEMVRQLNTNGHSDDPSKLLNWLQGFYHGLQTQLSSGALLPRYCVLP
jgi:hypothetical protein